MIAEIIPYDLTLRHRFTIARGSRTVEPVVILKLHHEGVTGIGEAAPSGRYGESRDTVMRFLHSVDWMRIEDPFLLERHLTAVGALSQGDAAAKAAVDIALHDWIGKRTGLPLHKMWGLDPARAPLTSFTIGIDTPQVVAQKVREAEQYPILKVKLGGDNDREIIEAIRTVTKKLIRVDANEGWKSKELALEKARWLEQEGVEFIEQPLPASDLEGAAWLKERSPIPLIADENCVRLHDIPPLRNAFHGINIKLMKCGGLREALAMIHAARACGLKIMTGCMIETSVAISAAAQFSPLIDYADLDGNVLTTNDPYRGVEIQDGRLLLNNQPGIGVSERAELHGE